MTKQNKCAIIQPTKGGFSMHNYAGTKEESESEFIKNYKVDGKEIIITFGDDHEYRINYNEQAIKNLNTVMKKQVEEKKTSTLTFKSITGFAVSAALITTGLMTTQNIPSQAAYIAPMACGLISLYTLSKGIHYALKSRDLKKNKYFLEIEDDLNKQANSNPNTFTGVENKIPEEVEQQDKVVFNLHSIDKVNFSTLKKLKTNLDCIHYVEENIEEKPKVLTKE